MYVCAEEGLTCLLSRLVCWLILDQSAAAGDGVPHAYRPAPQGIIDHACVCMVLL